MAADRPLSEALVGTWELRSRVDHTPSGEPRIDPSLGPNPLGLLIYDRQGHFAAQFMKRERGRGVDIDAAAAAPAAGPNNSRARGGYDAYFGDYAVDDVKGTVTQRLVGALSPEDVGHVLTRAMTVEGDDLTIRLDTATANGEPVVRILRWRRVA